MVNAGSFRKGICPNPRGRPRKADGETVAEMCRAHTVEAVAVILQVMHRGKDECARVKAASLLLDRGWGRTPQPATNQGVDKPLLMGAIFDQPEIRQKLDQILHGESPMELEPGEPDHSPTFRPLALAMPP